MPPGPSSVPSAASSFTSPAPVPPSKCPGNISANPIRAPTRAPAIEWPESPRPASARPTTATVAVSRFGIRPVRRSMVAAAPEAATTAASTIASDVGSSNDLPQHVVDLVAYCRHRAERDECDQPAQQRVFEQILAVIGPDLFGDERDDVLHVGHSLFLGSCRMPTRPRPAGIRGGPGALNVRLS